MQKTSEIKNILHELEFNEDWFDLGFVSTEKLHELWQDFQTSDDKNKEHYRWRAFISYLETNKEITEKELEELYRLGEIDNDNFGMGKSMKIKILQRNGCPISVENKALNSGEKPLIKVVKRKSGLEYN